MRAKENPTNLLSCRMLSEVLANNELWLYGPDSLKNGNKVQVNDTVRLSE